MILFKRTADLRKHLDQQRKAAGKIGFVPTMGALHDGHISLVDAARRNHDHVVCSIFVNPTQFNDASDFAKYPITIDLDINRLERAGCDVVFLPSVAEMYPAGIPKEHFDLGFLEQTLEGAFRPGHFQGVCMVVKRLLEKVMPDQLYLGRKDYQQCMVIRRLIEIMGYGDRIGLTIVPTLREPDGLAMSSRNVRIAPHDRKTAATIYQVLTAVCEAANKQLPGSVVEDAREKLVNAGFRVDYVAIVDAQTLQPIGEWLQDRSMVALVAAFLGEVRLIDNMVLGTKDQ